MQLFVQSTVCEAATRENQLRQNVSRGSSSCDVCDSDTCLCCSRSLKTRWKPETRTLKTKSIKTRSLKIHKPIKSMVNNTHCIRLCTFLCWLVLPSFGIDASLMDCKPISLTSHTKPLPRSTQLRSFPSNETQQPSISKTTSWGTTLTATSCNNKAYATSMTQQQHDQSNKSETKDQHSPASSRSMMKRSKPFIFKNIQPIEIWTIQVQSALKRLRATDLITIKKKLGRPYDKAKLSEISNSFIQSILFDIERLHTNEDPSMLDLCKILLQEIGELRTRLNDCL